LLAELPLVRNPPRPLGAISFTFSTSLRFLLDLSDDPVLARRFLFVTAHVPLAFPVSLFVPAEAGMMIKLLLPNNVSLPNRFYDCFTIVFYDPEPLSTHLV
jgi:hypothetical protein